MFFRPYKGNCKSSEEWKFSSKVSPWFLSKIRMFSYRYFFGELSQKRSFFDILDRKECFLDLQIKTFQRDYVTVFPKNSNIFSWIFFGQIKQIKFVLLMFWVKKNAF